MAPDYTTEIFHPSHSRHNAGMSTYKIDLPFSKSVHGEKSLSHLGPKTWNSLPAQIPLRKNVNTLKHDIKNLFFNRLQKRDDRIFIYYQPNDHYLLLTDYIFYYVFSLPLFFVFLNRS